jgi:3-carboxy-cis,cis-muconate cycloisomerase
MSGLNRASIHENERSGAAWTLEWLLVPAILVTSADIVMNTQEMIEKLIFNTK